MGHVEGPANLHLTLDVLPFRPPPNPFDDEVVKVQASLNRTPRYLFRLYASRSAGRTSMTEVTSPAQSDGDATTVADLFQLSPDQAATYLDSHLYWRCGRNCNLMSWTSSLPFAIQHGLRRHEMDNEPLSQIFVLVIDTHVFPRNTFLRDLEAIAYFKRYSEGLQKMYTLRTKSAYYFGEYLTQGHLDITDRCSQTSLDRLVDLGLFSLCPTLGNRESWNLLAKVVVELRKVFNSQPHATEESEVQRAVQIARICFGGPWILPTAVMLLSMNIRQRDDSIIVGGLRSAFTDPNIEELCASETNIECARLPEVKQYRNILRDLYSNTKGSTSEEMFVAFENLGLN